jgi:hypothetical protein
MEIATGSSKHGESGAAAGAAALSRGHHWQGAQRQLRQPQQQHQLMQQQHKPRIDDAEAHHAFTTDMIYALSHRLLLELRMR